jgi:hypothetical protein
MDCNLVLSSAGYSDILVGNCSGGRAPLWSRRGLHQTNTQTVFAGRLRVGTGKPDADSTGRHFTLPVRLHPAFFWPERRSP